MAGYVVYIYDNYCFNICFTKKIIYSFFPVIYKQTVKKGGISTEGLGQLEDFQISDKPVLGKFWTFFYPINVDVFFKGV